MLGPATTEWVTVSTHPLAGPKRLLVLPGTDSIYHESFHDPWHPQRVDRQPPLMSPASPRAVHDFSSADLSAALEFLERTRSELRSLRKVHVWPDRVQVFDVNGDYFEVLGLGYAQGEIIPVLRFVNTNFKPETIHNPTDRPYKEFLTGRRHAWAEDRVM